jgi:hypothetical protein
LKYSKCSYIRNAMNIYIQISYQPHWFCGCLTYVILRLYGAGLGFGSPNLNLNCSVIILTPKPPSNNTSCIVFFPIYTWITTIWLSIAIAVVPTFGIENQLVFMWLLCLNFEFSLVLTFAKNIFLIQELF